MIPRRFKTLVALFLGGMLAIHFAIAWIVKPQIAEGRPDFIIYYGEGRILRSTHPPRLYDESLQARLQQQTAAPGWTPRQVKPYMHPPFEALLFVPFSFLPFTSAYLMWAVFNVVLLSACILVLRSQLLIDRPPHFVWWMVAVLAFFPVFLTILEGQDTFLVLLAYSAAFAALRKNSDLSAGAWLGLGLVRPHLILPFVFVMLLRRKLRFLAGFALSCIAAALLSIGVMGWRGFLEYPRYIWSLEHTRSALVIPPQYIPNLRGLVDYFFANILAPHTLLWINGVLSLALLSWAWREWETVDKTRRYASDLGFALALIAASLVSYHEFIYDLTVLLIPISILLRARPLSNPSPRWWWLPVLLLFLTPLYILLWYRWGLLNLMALAEVALACCIIVEERRFSCPVP